MRLAQSGTVLLIIALLVPGGADADTVPPVVAATVAADPAAPAIHSRSGAPTPLRDFVRREVVIPAVGTATARRQTAARETWVRRHPAAFGAVVGFAAGFAIGYIPGDDAVFDDFTAGFNGLVLGGVGAGVGAVVGHLLGRR